MDSNLSPSSSNTPQILSRSVLASLIQNLDASDGLECYQLVRKAKLMTVEEDSNNNNNNTTTIPSIYITKQAVGIRYHPSTNNNQKRPLELTLEYGPTRFGMSQNEEAVLHTSSNSAVQYSNEAKVYYTTKILQSEWDSAIYMASLTGAVLPSLLESALHYPTQHARYQPFAVYQKQQESAANTEGGDNNSLPPKLVLKSSSSSDFVQHLWTFLARVNVELSPIIVPSTTVAAIYVQSDVVKVSGVDESTQQLHSSQAYEFYHHLQHCIHAVLTRDYSEYTPTVAPSSMPSTSMPTTTSMDDNNSTEAPTSNNNNNNNDMNQTEAPTAAPSSSDSTRRRRRLEQDGTLHDDESTYTEQNDEDSDNTATTLEDTDTLTNSTYVPTVLNNNKDQQSSSDTNTTTTTTTFSPSVAPSQQTTVDEAAQAQQAADAAKEAAAEAKNAAQSDVEHKAANAAEAAANAAQKAADATFTKKAQQAMNDLTSGDGTLMSGVISQCFSDPQYQINTSQAYLYLDGAFYYKLNLTAPYLDVVRVNRTLPKPPSFDAYTGGDFVDWTLATILFSLIGMCVLFTCQQMGLQIIKPLFRVQMWFFSPRHYNRDGSNDNDDDFTGQGFEHAFGEDVIPLSMGGRRPMHHEEKGHLILPEDDDNDDDAEDLFERESSDHPNLSYDSGGDVEMPERRRSSIGDVESTSHHSRRESLMSGDVPERFSRDPDLVDLPNLVSRSRVAVPVGHRSRTSTTDMDEGGSSSLTPTKKSDNGITWLS